MLTYHLILLSNPVNPDTSRSTENQRSTCRMAFSANDACHHFMGIVLIPAIFQFAKIARTSEKTK
ncbi:hypothetical protein [Prevotella sp. S7-1-8]|uniref:hypothetical protein n=1 Tax=Prevotella sp. S7-1-8 TaxID=1284775 RepID=UPI000A9E6F60|nr:hypothetical protein [Prevotella sp. S7-1-8]